MRPYLDQAAVKLVLHTHETVLADIPCGERVAFAVRDPIERFISGFNDMRRQSRPRYHSPWRPAEAAALRSFPSASVLATQLSTEDGARREEAIRAMEAIRHVARGLSFWLGGIGHLKLRAPDIV
jgi:hypothetical protein